MNTKKGLFRVLARVLVVGSILGAAVGGMSLGWVPTGLLMGLLGLVLFISAIKTFQHAR